MKNKSKLNIKFNNQEKKNVGEAQMNNIWRHERQ